VAPEQKVVAVGLPSDMVGGEQKTCGHLLCAPPMNLSAPALRRSTALHANAATLGVGWGNITRGSSAGSSNLCCTNTSASYYIADSYASGQTLGVDDSGSRGLEDEFLGEFDASAVAAVGVPGDNFPVSLAVMVGSLEADGGLPGPDLATRIAKTALLALVVMGQAHDTGYQGFTAHLTRMTEFLAQHPLVAPQEIEELLRILRGTPIKVNGNILAFLNDPGWARGDDALRMKTWSEIRTALSQP
jgi:hypothetical protein